MHAIALTSTTPAKKWLAQAQKELDNIGTDEFRNRLNSWFSLVGKKGTKTISFNKYEGDPNELIAPSNVDILKGLAWYCSLFQQDDDIARVDVYKRQLLGRAVVIVDDVCTSGATLAECVREVMRCGASQVVALTVARTVLRKDRVQGDDESASKERLS